MNTKQLIRTLLALFLLSMAVSVPLAHAGSSQQSFHIPTTITVKMYQLKSDGSRTSLLCSATNHNLETWGCTAKTDDPQHAYPFSLNPVTVDIEGNDPGDPQHGVDYNRYLRDVVPEEVAITMSSRGNKPLSTVKAQAIAARTYVYLRQGLTINNSAQYQVFVPYYYDTLTAAQQQRVNEAVSDVWYMTLPSSDDPINALYGADNRDRTSQGSTSYLKSVADPISDQYGCAIFDDQGNVIGYHNNSDPECGTGNGGMSSKGASRWGFGHTSSKGPVASNDSRYPHDVNGLGDFWGVRYDWAKQILTHYYTGIHIRDASGTILTPAYRWVPLSVTWSGDCPPSMQHGQTCTATFEIQNSGTTTWPGTGQVYLWYHGWEASGYRVQEGGGSQGISQTVAPGETIVQTVTFTAPTTPHPGAPYRLRFDLFLEGYGWASELEPGRPWPTYDVMVCVDGPCQVFLPLVIKN